VTEWAWKRCRIVVPLHKRHWLESVKFFFYDQTHFPWYIHFPEEKRRLDPFPSVFESHFKARYQELLLAGGCCSNRTFYTSSGYWHWHQPVSHGWLAHRGGKSNNDPTSGRFQCGLQSTPLALRLTESFIS